MTFEPKKMDKKYKVFLAIMIGIIGVACFFPFIFEFEWLPFLILGGVFLITGVGIIWAHLSIRYTFTEETLNIHGGLFRFKIPYDKITSVTRTTDYLSGMNVMTATKGLAIQNMHVAFGEVKITPADEEAFLLTLKKYAPHVSLDSL